MEPTTVHAIVQVATLLNRMLPSLWASGAISEAQLTATAKAGQHSDAAYDHYRKSLLKNHSGSHSDPTRQEVAQAVHRLAQELGPPE